MFITNKFLSKLYTNTFVTVKCDIKVFFANTSHKVTIAFRPLIEGLSKVTSSA